LRQDTHELYPYAHAYASESDNYIGISHGELSGGLGMNGDYLKGRLLRYWTYFRRGHGVYLVFAISFLNFIVIQWSLLIEQIPPLQALFQHFYMFAILFFITYLPLATVIGWIDYKRGAMPVDQTVAAKANPWVQDLSKAIVLLAEGKNEEVIKLMKKWTTK
jgi:hypothetical protein